MELINQKKSPIQDDYIEKYLAEKDLNLTATLDAKSAYKDAEFVVIAAPTNYDSKKNFFDTSAVEAVIKLVIEYNPDAIMVIKSTIPVGYTASIREKFHCDNIIFNNCSFTDFEESLRRFMIICIHHASLLEQMWRMQDLSKQRTHLPDYYRKVQ